ncbi:MAG: MFS transporter, partial [Actinomycetota bacterium]|nr:MFS transporter [Actinomycetota bacterium]
ALLLPSLAARFGRRRMLVVYLLGTPAALCAYAATTSVAAAVVALLAVGGLYVGILAGLSTVVQLRAPADLRARVLSLFFVALGTIFPLGTLVQGWLADQIGLAATTVAGALTLATVVIVLGAVRPAVLAALEDPASVPSAQPPVVAMEQVTGVETAARPSR